MKVKQIVKVLALGGALIATSPTMAAKIKFGGQEATDGSGLTSGFIDPSNIMPVESGFFVETFDQNTANPQYVIPDGQGGLTPAGVYFDENNATVIGDFSVSGVSGDFTYAYTDYSTADLTLKVEGILEDEVEDYELAVGHDVNTCGVNSYPGLDITTTGGGFSVRQDNTSWAAHVTNNNAMNNDTCYGFAPTRNGDVPASITTDYSQVLDFTGADEFNYIGLYFGSIDTYNMLEFGYTNDDGDFVTVTSIDGEDIIDRFELQSGSRTTAQQYVNIFFNDDELFTAFRVSTEGVAVEYDNIVVGRVVPEPTSLAILGLGLLGLAGAKRRKSE